MGEDLDSIRAHFSKRTRQLKVTVAVAAPPVDRSRSERDGVAEATLGSAAAPGLPAPVAEGEVGGGQEAEGRRQKEVPYGVGKEPSESTLLGSTAGESAAEEEFGKAKVAALDEGPLLQQSLPLTGLGLDLVRMAVDAASTQWSNSKGEIKGERFIAEDRDGVGRRTDAMLTEVTANLRDSAIR
jgi:hypothetical protein